MHVSPLVVYKSAAQQNWTRNNGQEMNDRMEDVSLSLPIVEFARSSYTNQLKYDQTPAAAL